MAFDFGRRKLSRAKLADLERLARWLKVSFAPCACARCHARLVEKVARATEKLEAAFPPRLTERKW